LILFLNFIVEGKLQMSTAAVTVQIIHQNVQGEQFTADIPLNWDNEELKSWLVSEGIIAETASVHYTVEVRPMGKRLLGQGLQDGDQIIIRENRLRPTIRDRKPLSS
jgi:hypothetical protein